MAANIISSITTRHWRLDSSSTWDATPRAVSLLVRTSGKTSDADKYHQLRTVWTASHLLTQAFRHTPVAISHPQEKCWSKNCSWLITQFARSDVQPAVRISNRIPKTQQMCPKRQDQTDRQTVHITNICKNNTPGASLFIPRRTAKSSSVHDCTAAHNSSGWSFYLVCLYNSRNLMWTAHPILLGR